MLDLDLVSPKRFHIGWSWKGICLSQEADTTAPNVVWMKSIAIWWHWPPVQWNGGFYDRKELAQAIQSL